MELLRILVDKGNTVGYVIMQDGFAYKVPSDNINIWNFTNVSYVGMDGVYLKDGNRVPMVSLESIKTLYHGSKYGLTDKIVISDFRNKTDFGSGFYLNTIKKRAESWVCNEPSHKVYKFFLDTTNLRCYKFTKEKFKLWAIFIGVNRGYISLKELSPTTRNSIKSLYTYDVLIGDIADDRLYQAYYYFINGLLSIEGLYNCIKYVDLGIQYTLKSNMAVQELACSKVYTVNSKDYLTYLTKPDMSNLIKKYASQYRSGQIISDVRREDLCL